MAAADGKLISGLWAPVMRSFIALFILTILPYSIHPPFTEAKGDIKQYDFKFKFHLAFLWAVMTNFFIATPKIGSVAKVGAQHVLGTLLGSFAGVGIVAAANWCEYLADYKWFTLCMSLAGVLSNLLGWYLKTPGTSMLIVISCVLIVFATESQEAAMMFHYTRIFGMIGGVILSQILAVFVFPTAATQEVVSQLASILEQLAVLNDTAWEHTGMHTIKPIEEPEAQPVVKRKKLSRTKSTMMKMQSNANWLQNADPQESRSCFRLAAGACKDGACDIVQALVTFRLEKALIGIYKGLDAMEAAVPLTRTEIAVEYFRGRWGFLPGLSIFRRMPLPEADIANVAWSIRKCARILWTLHLTFQDGVDQEMIDILKQQYPRDMIKSLMEGAHDALWDLVDCYPSGKEVNWSGVERFEAGVQALFAINDYQRRRVSEHYKKYKNLALLNEFENNPDVQRASMKMSSINRTVSQPTSTFLNAVHSRHSSGSVDFAVNPSASSDSKLRDVTDMASLLGQGPTRGRISAIPESSSQESFPESQQREGSRAPQNSSEEAIQRLSEGVEVVQGGRLITLKESSSEKDMKLEIPDVDSADLKMFPQTPEGYVSMVRWYSFQFLLEEVSIDLRELAGHLEGLLEKMPDYGVKA